ncbi:ECF transporter S component [Dellaglioa carnosa]|uniref:ECF transporter S component n=1 Tax=Dellaglioa carnosa TaxID=2995136 RepID=A0ABT4JND7_9LACO|nr:ECF transporter S component [Dellaglioa carnosa]MCZ2491526.1 ECF transporter S component [Dellaglioa carnosa]MCZ2494603.1 ECF transporter S component [Dellaglioa carnosa]MDK1731466.1 ECF transporter S component [Dellaglioa carnosa]
MKTNNKTYHMSILALFIAIVIVQNFVPLFGYIPVGPLSITTIHITVIVAALVLGWKDGAFVGGVWGLITFIRAFVSPTSPIAPIVFTNPIVSIVPRILIGIVTAVVFYFIYKWWKNKTLAMIIASVLGSLVNTVLVLGLIYLLYHGQAANFYKVDMGQLLPYIMGLVVTNGVPEMILAGVVAPLIAAPLQKLVRKG